MPPASHGPSGIWHSSCPNRDSALSTQHRSRRVSSLLALLPLGLLPPSSRHFPHHTYQYPPSRTHATQSPFARTSLIFPEAQKGAEAFQAFPRLHRETFGAGLLVTSYTLISSIQYPFFSIMAPKKRSQTPRHSGVAEPSASVPSQQPQSQQQHSLPTTTTTTTTTLLSSSQPTSTDRDRRRQPRGTRQPISSAQSPIIQDSVSSSRSPIVSDYPLSPIDGFAPGSHSRRESTSTMRTSSISMDAAPTCTPTGRVSKAKKGKRVHACEFPGCGKVSRFWPIHWLSGPPSSGPQDLDPRGKERLANARKQVFTRAEHRR